MEKIVQFLEAEGKDASELDEAVADYMIQLANEGGTEEEVWGLLEGLFPELEESPASKDAFSAVFLQLQNPGSPDPSPATPTADQQPSLELHQTRPSLAEGGSLIGGDAKEGILKDEDDVDFLREMMPQVSDRGLRYVLRCVAKGSRVTAASYLAERCAEDSSSDSVRGLEADAEAYERKEVAEARKAEEAERRAQEAKRRDKEEREALKDKIVGRYADEVKVDGVVLKVAIPCSTEKKKTIRYRDGKVVTTTGAKVIVEAVKEEWDGGSRGKVKTKGKRGKGFV